MFLQEEAFDLLHNNLLLKVLVDAVRRALYRSTSTIRARARGVISLVQHVRVHARYSIRRVLTSPLLRIIPYRAGTGPRTSTDLQYIAHTYKVCVKYTYMTSGSCTISSVLRAR